MNNEGLLMIFCAVAGGFSLVASIANWDFFFNSRKAAFFLNILGRKGARIFYGALGAALLGVATKALMEMY